MDEYQKTLDKVKAWLHVKPKISQKYKTKYAYVQIHAYNFSTHKFAEYYPDVIIEKWIAKYINPVIENAIDLEQTFAIAITSEECKKHFLAPVTSWSGDNLSKTETEARAAHDMWYYLTNEKKFLDVELQYDYYGKFIILTFKLNELQKQNIRLKQHGSAKTEETESGQRTSEKQA